MDSLWLPYLVLIRRIFKDKKEYHGIPIKMRTFGNEKNPSSFQWPLNLLAPFIAGLWWSLAFTVATGLPLTASIPPTGTS